MAVSELHREAGHDIVVGLQIRVGNDVHIDGDLIRLAPDDEAEMLSTSLELSRKVTSQLLPWILTISLHIVVELG